MWTSNHTVAFKEVKDILLSPAVLKTFDLHAETVLQTDASRKNGLGFALMQKQGEKWCLIQCGSRFLSDTETRYATIELECLAIAWATKKCRLFLAGLPHFKVMTDHRPLLPILNQKTMDQVENVHLLRYKQALSGYNFEVFWVKGKEHVIPDTLSRSPVHKPTPEEEMEFSGDIDYDARHEIQINMIQCDDDNNKGPSSSADITLVRLKKTTASDEEYADLRRAIEDGAPLGKAASFSKIFDELFVEDDLIIWGNPFIIPRQC